jgi:hypothetical protein
MPKNGYINAQSNKNLIYERNRTCGWQRVKVISAN